MKNNQFNHDFGQMMDKIFEIAQKCGEVIEDEFSKKSTDFPFLNQFIDFYPAYSYPPFNSYLDLNKNLVFQFALAGFEQKDVSLTFQGDYLIFSAQAPQINAKEPLRYFKRRLKIKDIEEQKYYVPKERFDQNAVKATFNNGLLTIQIPTKKEQAKNNEIKINIEEEDENNAG